MAASSAHHPRTTSRARSATDRGVVVLSTARDLDSYVAALRRSVTDRIDSGLSVLLPDPGGLADVTGKGPGPEQDASKTTYDSSLADLLGPFWSSRQVEERLQYNSKQALGNDRSRGNVLALKTGNGRLAYPISQFRDRAGRTEVKPGQAAMIKVLKGEDPWRVAVLMHNPAPELGQRTPLEWERAGGSVGDLAALARRVRHEWAQ